MFDRKKYKKFAKAQLKGRWVIPVIMTVIVLLVDFLFTLPGLIKVTSSDDFWYIMNSPGMSFEDFETLSSIFDSSSSLLVSIIQGIVTAILEIATLNVYLKMTMSPAPVSFSGFLEGLNNWGRSILAYLWRALWTVLWTVLTTPILCIPAIIKSIAYSQMFYIVAENKEISIPKALKISMLITKGHKGELFVMYITFIGWVLLASLTMGIGFIFLTPYMNMTFLNAYHAMLQEAFESGRIQPEDLSE